MANTTGAQRLAESMWYSFEVVMDHMVDLQERNVRFSQALVEGTIRELHDQAEINLAVTQELLECAEDGREAFQTLIEESMNAVWDLAYAPFAYSGEGIKATIEVVK